MLLRVILAVADNSIKKHFRQALRQTDAEVYVLKGANNVWDRAITRGGDLLLIDRLTVMDAIADGANVDPGMLSKPAVLCRPGSVP